MIKTYFVKQKKNHFILYNLKIIIIKLPKLKTNHNITFYKYLFFLE